MAQLRAERDAAIAARGDMTAEVDRLRRALGTLQWVLEPLQCVHLACCALMRFCLLQRLARRTHVRTRTPPTARSNSACRCVCVSACIWRVDVAGWR
jgi:hypothetical protein